MKNTTNMQPFIGTKQVMAIPMNRYDYNELRGWKLPVNEDGSDEGYLVEYMDGGQANHPDFAGYISWSPRAVFDNAYKPNGSFEQRLSLELDELQTRLVKLCEFIRTEKFLNLDPGNRALLRTQKELMGGLSHVLIRRLELITRGV